MITKKHLLPIFFLFLFASYSFAQTSIKGTILDKVDAKAIEFANITVLTQDSVFVKGDITNNDGKFSINDVPIGSYLLKISSLGYETSYTDLYNLNQKIDLGSIFLSPKSTMLNSVTVTANGTIEKVDKKIILPSEVQIKTSNSGVSLLRNLQLNRLSIDPINNTITTTSGGSVQLCINGAPVDKEEIRAIQPKDILRIEYFDEPTMRYENAAAVINFVIKQKETGGSFSTNLQNSLSDVSISDNSLNAKYNYKKSEFGIDAYWRYRKINWTRENIDSFVYPDKQIDRTDKGDPTRYKENVLNLNLSYNLYEVDKYMLNIRLKDNLYDSPNEYSNREGEMYETGIETPYQFKDLSSSHSNSPSLDIYFERKLKNDQSIIFNVVGTYIDTDADRRYTESRDESMFTDVISDVSGSKYSLITQGVYEKSWKSSKLSGGVKHAQSYTKNEYSGDVVDAIGLNFAETYTYLEYQYKYKKFNYSLGFGGTRTYNSQGENSNVKFILNPALRVMYNIKDGIYVRYNGRITGDSPSLADLNDIEQSIDLLQIRRGNPNLKSASSYSNSLEIGFNKGKFQGTLYANYAYTKNPIMEQILLEDDKFVRTNDNQKSFQRINLQMPLKFKPYKEYFTLNVTPGFNRYISDGNNYLHTYSNFYIRASLLANYKNWSFYNEINTRYNGMWGETISRGERIQITQLSYNKERWSAGLMVFFPFSKDYSQDSRSLSSLTPSFSKVSSNNMGQILLATFSYNIQFGKKRKSASQSLNNEDTDKGILSGNK